MAIEIDTTQIEDTAPFASGGGPATGTASAQAAAAAKAAPGQAAETVAGGGEGQAVQIECGTPAGRPNVNVSVVDAGFARVGRDLSVSRHKRAGAIADEGLLGDLDPPGAPGQADLPLRNLDPQTASQVTLATLAFCYTLYFGQSILFPIGFAVLLALLFRPVVRRLRKHRIPEPAGAAAVLLFVLGLGGIGLYQVANPAAAFLSSVPEQLDQAKDKVKTLAAPFRKINSALKTGDKLASGAVVEEATAPAEGAAAQEPVEPTVVVRSEQPPLSEYLMSRTTTFLGGSVLCLVLLYFLLANGDDLINNVLRTLPTVREKRGVVELLYAAEAGMSRYLLTVTLINGGLGLCVAVAMFLLKMPNPLLWGAMAFAFNFIPYVGAIAGMLVIGLVSFLAFDKMSEAVIAPIVYFSLTAIEGNFVTPNILGNRISLNPVMVFLSLAFWGWIWGIGGALIAVPLLAMAKIVCEQFKPLHAIATLLDSKSSLADDQAAG